MKTIKIISNSAWEIMPPEKKLKILKKIKLNNSLLIHEKISITNRNIK